MGLYDFDRHNEPTNESPPWWGKLLAAAVGVGLLCGFVELLEWLAK